MPSEKNGGDSSDEYRWQERSSSRNGGDNSGGGSNSGGESIAVAYEL